MITTRALGKRLTRTRKARGKTQSQVAAGLGVARSTLVAMEKGERRPSNSQLRQWSELLGVTLHELVRPWAVRSEAAPGFRQPRIPGVEQDALEQATVALSSLAGRFAELEKRLHIHRPPAPLETLDTYRAQEAPELEPRLAAESAAAARLELPLATDDARQAKVARGLYPTIEVVSTLDILRSAVPGLGLDIASLRQMARRIRVRASFLPPKSDPNRAWFLDLLTGDDV